MLTKLEFADKLCDAVDELSYAIEHKGLSASDAEAWYGDIIRDLERMLPRYKKTPHYEFMEDLLDTLWGLRMNAGKADDNNEAIDIGHHRGFLYDTVWLPLTHKLDDLEQEG